uniref:Uncharacterized protein n=1 Tax=Sus scrofa TaxID=9823 RepID=A0A8D0SUP7_PIG
MRIPGDIVSALLQGHRTRQARLGVAVSGGRGGCPAPDGAAGLAGQESHPRAAAQRRTHGPCADLPRGETKVRGAARPAGTYARRRAPSLSQGERSGNLCSQCGVSLRVRVESLTARCSASAVPK